MSSSIKPILVAMSGGVDSAVAALLLRRQGLEIEGAYMKNWINEDKIAGNCPWEDDIRDARAAADHIGIPFRVVNLMGAYRERVVRYLLDSYNRGLTPNPDVMCNRDIKFGVLLQWARDHGFGAVATGHYARRIEHEAGRVDLAEGADKNKDQSYFLALLRQDQIRNARFPLGDLTKPQVRKLARDAGLPNAGKKDSQGICFIGNVKMADFLRAYLPAFPGEIADTDGKILGRHSGLHFFTIGQRKGIGIPSNADHRKYVVVGKDKVTNRLIVAFDHPEAPGLFSRENTVGGLSFTGDPITAPRRLLGRVRYRDPAVPLEFIPAADGTARIRFDPPQRAIAPGQILALYEGEKVIGGAIFTAENSKTQ